MAAVVSYSPPWWVKLLHRLPHFNLRFEQTSGDFQPEDWTYQQCRRPPRGAGSDGVGVGAMEIFLREAMTWSHLLSSFTS
ncbi:unnamed protein product [Pleuronectes platessa]|uniref:Uncharacterized protein n=1 Tax=Pleuronectes platessa TaxID=8262 RepID=A0A9N7Z753_PLEPL|nr:unnamed protein product [Pleuronectes platessa]